MELGNKGNGPVLRFKLNGKTTAVPALPDRKLLEVLRAELELTGTKYGCGEGECGACAVLLDGESVAACQIPVGELEGREVVTVEGLAQEGKLTPVQRAFVDSSAFQCGFCTAGMVIGATALLRKNPQPSEAEVREALQGHICRCGGYTRILHAVRRASEQGVSTAGGGP